MSRVCIIVKIAALITLHTYWPVLGWAYISTTPQWSRHSVVILPASSRCVYVREIG